MRLFLHLILEILSLSYFAIAILIKTERTHTQKNNQRIKKQKQTNLQT